MLRPTRPRRSEQEAEEATARRTPLAWYRWYPGDHLRQLRGWPLIARAVYRELLDAQWDLEVLPPAPQRLRELVGATPKEWRVAWPLCAPHFPRSGQVRRNAALERLRAVQVELVERCRRAGRAGNRVRWSARGTVIPLRPEADDA